MHYAYAINEHKVILMLNVYEQLADLRDSKFLLAEEYLNREVQADEWFRVKNFRLDEIRRQDGIHSLIRCFEYHKIKKAIEQNTESDLNQLSANLAKLSLTLKDIPFVRSDNTWIEGAIYLPPLEYAMYKRCFTSFRYFLDNTMQQQPQQSAGIASASGSISVLNLGSAVSSVNANKNDRQASSKSKLSRTSTLNATAIEMNLNSLREKAEEEQMDEIIDILDDFGEDLEIKAVTNEEYAQSLERQKQQQLQQQQQHQHQHDESRNKQQKSKQQSHSKSNKSDNLSSSSSASRTCSIL